MTFRTTAIITALTILRCAAAHAADCRDHVAQAEGAHGVPAGLLSAIGYVESGMDSLAVNADGTSYHPSSRQEAVDLVRSLQRAGARFIDVGCMQIDLTYHPQAFSSLEQAFEPAANAAIGASLLVDNRATYGDWTSAVAFYHSSNPAEQAAYLRRVAQRLAGGAAAPMPPIRRVIETRAAERRAAALEWARRLAALRLKDLPNQSRSVMLERCSHEGERKCRKAT